eukprot:470692-Prorocentrum_minimum.AAC.2
MRQRVGGSVSPLLGSREGAKTGACASECASESAAAPANRRLREWGWRASGADPSRLAGRPDVEL